MKEGAPLQSTLFTGEWVDNRTRRQKQRDNDHKQLQQTEMFSQRDLAQFGVRARPLMDLHPGRLQLIREDPRTPEEIEADLLREAQRLTTPMFIDEDDPGEGSENESKALSSGDNHSAFPYVELRGARRRQRAVSIKVRRRRV